MGEPNTLIKGDRQSDFFDVCKQCEADLICCRNANPPISSERKKIIEEYLKAEKISVESLFAHTAYISPKVDDGGYCIFYDKETRKCTIHPVKPETCVAGPITFGINKNSQKIEWGLKMEKICSLAGKLYKNEEVLRRHLESAKKEILRLVRELDSEALKTILKIEEPETFKIGEDDIEKRVLEKIK